MKLTETRVNSNIVLLMAFVLLGVTTVLVVHNTVRDPLPVYAVLYLCTFVAIAWLYPQTALLITFAAAPFQNDVSNNFGPLRFSVVEINLLLITIVFVLRAAKSNVDLKFGPTMPPVLFYIGLCVASSLPTGRFASGLPALVQIILYMVVAVVIYSSFVESTSQFKRACFALIGVCLFLTILEFMNGTAYILGLHKNGVGSSLACGLIVCAEFWLAEPRLKQRVWLSATLLLLTAGLVYSLSRGAWLGAIGGLLAVLLIRRQFRVVIQVCLAMIPVAILLWNFLPEEKRESASNFDVSTDNVRIRLATIDYAWRVFQENPLQGAGITVRKDIDATNVVLITLAETGVPGLLAFLLIQFQAVKMAWRTLPFVPKNSATASALLISAGLVNCKLIHGVVDHYWARGTLSITWASVGVATGIYYAVKNERKALARQSRLRLPGPKAIS